MSSRVARSDRGNSTWTSFLSLSLPFSLSRSQCGWWLLGHTGALSLAMHTLLARISQEQGRNSESNIFPQYPDYTLLWRGWTFNKVLITKLLKIWTQEMESLITCCLSQSYLCFSGWFYFPSPSPLLSSVMLMQPALSGQSSHLSSLLHSRVGDTSRLHPSFYFALNVYIILMYGCSNRLELSVSEREDNNEMADILS